MPGCCHILLSHTHDNDASFIALNKSNDLYFIAGSAHLSSSSRVSRLANEPQLLSKLWHQRIGHPCPTPLSVFAKHINGLPSLFTADLHPMHSCKACNDEKIIRVPMDANSDTDPLFPGTRFHLDCGFISASSADFGISAVNLVITSYDGNNMYLLLVCAKSCHTWIFCQASKSPLIFIIERFLELHGLKTGSSFLHMDQGGELWCSHQLRDIAATAGCTMEPTGSYPASENGKVERPNGTFSAVVRCLLYSAGVSAIFWSAYLVHAVNLKNRLYHKALHKTPHEAWTGEKPPLDHLRTFGALVMARKPGKRPANADRHKYHGVLLSMVLPPKMSIMNSESEKLSTHHTIDEAHYGKTRRPPGLHILMDMGYEQHPVLPVITTPLPLSRCPLRSRHKTVTPFLCKLPPLPMNEFTSVPFDVVTSVSASDIDHNNSVTVTLSTDPFGPSFPETILVSGIYPTLGIALHYNIDRHRCQFISMAPGAHLHRLFQWKSCLRSAYILSIDTMTVHTIADVRLIIYEARSAKSTSVVIAFMKDDAPNCLSVVGLPQLYFDQMCIMRGYIDNTVLAVVHKAIMCPKFNRHILQKHLDCKDWLAA
jgi:hypothetical protein